MAGVKLPVHLDRFVLVYPLEVFFTGTKATMVVDCTVDGKNNKEDKTILIDLWVAGGVQLPVHLDRFLRAHCCTRLFVVMLMMMMMMVMMMMMINTKSQ